MHGIIRRPSYIYKGRIYHACSGPIQTGDEHVRRIILFRIIHIVCMLLPPKWAHHYRVYKITIWNAWCDDDDDGDARVFKIISITHSAFVGCWWRFVCLPRRLLWTERPVERSFASKFGRYLVSGSSRQYATEHMHIAKPYTGATIGWKCSRSAHQNIFIQMANTKENFSAKKPYAHSYEYECVCVMIVPLCVYVLV